MFFAREQDLTKKYFLFSKDSNGAGKNEFVSQYTFLQSHFFVTYKR